MDRLLRRRQRRRRLGLQERQRSARHLYSVQPRPGSRRSLGGRVRRRWPGRVRLPGRLVGDRRARACSTGPISPATTCSPTRWSSTRLTFRGSPPPPAASAITERRTCCIYVKGGGAWVRDDYSSTSTAGLLLASASVTRSGWTAGGGFEQVFAGGWSWFAEYNYLNFGTNTVTFATNHCRPSHVPDRRAAGHAHDRRRRELSLRTGTLLIAPSVKTIGSKEAPDDPGLHRSAGFVAD